MYEHARLHISEFRPMFLYLVMRVEEVLYDATDHHDEGGRIATLVGSTTLQDVFTHLLHTYIHHIATITNPQIATRLSMLDSDAAPGVVGFKRTGAPLWALLDGRRCVDMVRVTVRCRRGAYCFDCLVDRRQTSINAARTRSPFAM